MRKKVFHHLKYFSRALRARLVALLLLIAQVSAGLIVPLHAVAHNQGVHAQREAGKAARISSPNNPLSFVFGHDQGLGCDDWAAAFVLDSLSGHGAPDTTPTLATTTDIVDRLAAPPPASPFSPFLSHAPPRS